MFEMSADMKVQMALHEFESHYNIRPNRITMGHHLVDELLHQTYWPYFPIRAFEDLVCKQKIGVFGKYEGIPVKIDYDNHDILEVGYMVEWMENKY